MDLRVTFNSTIRQALASNVQSSARTARSQKESLEGKQLLEPSDNPLNSILVRTNKARENQLLSHLENVREAQSILNGSVSTLVDVAELFAQAGRIATEGANSFNDTTSREALAREVDGLIDNLFQLANQQQGDQYLYSGIGSDTPPFQRNEATGAIEYSGASEDLEALIGPGRTIRTLYSGAEIFQSRQRGETLYLGSTGASAGTGTDNATAQSELLVQHVVTTYSPGSGIQPGTGSPGSDTVLGPLGAHHLLIDDTSGTGSSGTISLNGGPLVPFTNTDTNLSVPGPAGERVFVDTTAIVPGFSGTVDLTADGTISVDGGLTSVPIDFSTNQVVTDSQTEAVTNVSTENVRQVGTDSLIYSGTYDAFQILQALRDDLRNPRGRTEQQQGEALSRHIAEIRRVRTHVLEAAAEQGVTLKKLDDQEIRLQDEQLLLRELNADLEGTDLAEIIVNLRAQENQLQLIQAVTLRLFDQNLLNFLR